MPPPPPIRRLALGIAAALLVGCAAASPPGAGPPPGRNGMDGPPPAPRVVAPDALAMPVSDEDKLPTVPHVAGPIALQVIYPSQRDRIGTAVDTSFMFGATGTGEAVLTINGQRVPVWPNGAWLAWVPFPPDSIMQFDLVARTPTDSVGLVYEARRARRFIPPDTSPWIDSSSIAPRGKVWWPENEPLTVSVRASPGATVEVRFADDTRVPLLPDPRLEDVPWGIRAFDRDTANLARPVQTDRYIGTVSGLAAGNDPGPMLGPATNGCPHMGRGMRAGNCPRHRATADSLAASIEVIQGTDTVAARWPIDLAVLERPMLVEFDDDTLGAGDTDRLTVGRAAPGATYHWFFPTGTRAVATGRINGNLRLRLSRAGEAWVPADDAMPLPPGRSDLVARVGSMTMTPDPAKVRVRIPLSDRIPFRVWETQSEIKVRLYGAVGDIDWIRYGGGGGGGAGAADRLVALADWDQSAADEVTLTFALSQPVWGYRTGWSGSDLILDIRHPPTLNASNPLRNRIIVVDPGHPPAGATGPTGLTEAEANLGVAMKLRQLLERDGAVVFMTREADSAVGLWPRIKLANDLNAEILVSIHNNALPDGVNPFTNNGTSVFYNHPRSIPLAFAVQAALVEELGLRNLGVGRGDLALVRPTWMPSILTEGLFMMLPRQEAALRTDAGQMLYARGVHEGIKTFLKERARAQ